MTMGDEDSFAKPQTISSPRKKALLNVPLGCCSSGSTAPLAIAVQYGNYDLVKCTCSGEC